MNTQNVKGEVTKTSEEELIDLKADEEHVSEVKGGGGAIAGIVIAATSDNNRVS